MNNLPLRNVSRETLVELHELYVAGQTMLRLASSIGISDRHLAVLFREAELPLRKAGRRKRADVGDLCEKEVERLCAELIKTRQKERGSV